MILHLRITDRLLHVILSEFPVFFGRSKFDNVINKKRTIFFYHFQEI